MTQRELADAAGIGKRSVEDYERGQVPRKAVPALARALGVSSHYLLHGVDALEERIETIASEVAAVERRLTSLERLTQDSADATGRMYVSLDATIRLLLAQLASTEVLAKLPPPLSLPAANGDKPEGVEDDTVEELGGVGG